ncbi:hypothetical protein DSM104443_03873 [Usitatibacter rugosus]|uniref:Uncharacterized protein n=2 Tax=Usitatibacter rugosus TaxID=2732067 RepID=A0A6M4GZV3_9PROT|nr:hypothetical protein DSM104443_03873 [Usitatibacter rugosus]
MALVATGWWGLSSLPDASSSSTHLKTVVAPAPLEVPVSAIPAGRNASSDPDAWSAMDSVSTAGSRFRDSKDLRAFFDRAKEVGGSAYLYYATKARGRCLNVILLGNMKTEQMMASGPEGQDTVRMAAWREWSAPCARFEGYAISQEEGNQLYQRLRDADEGPAAQFFKASVTSDQHKGLVRGALESGSPELADLVAPRIAYLAKDPPPRGATEAETKAYAKWVQAEQTSWKLAVCELGAYCGRGSETWIAACMATGECGEGNYRRPYRYFFYATVADLQAIAARRDAIVEAVRARDWAALGLAP